VSGLGGELFSEPNQPRAINRIIKRLSQAGCARVLIEGGSYQSVLIAALRAADLPVVIVNPRRVREFAKSIGRLAKTDEIDVRVLALFGERPEPPLRELADEQTQSLRMLWVRREQLIEMLVMEENRLEHAPVKAKAVQHNLRSHIDYLRKQIKQADDDLDREVRNSPLWDKYELLSSVPGGGSGAQRCTALGPARVGSAQPRRDRRAGGRVTLDSQYGRFRFEASDWLLHRLAPRGAILSRGRTIENPEIRASYTKGNPAMNEAFQQALKAQDLEVIRKVPKTDLHNHGVAGADPASVEEILGRRFAPLDHKLRSMAEMHAWASENLGNINPKLGPSVARGGVCSCDLGRPGAL
jgi:hypothetical protein